MFYKTDGHPHYTHQYLKSICLIRNMKILQLLFLINFIQYNSILNAKYLLVQVNEVGNRGILKGNKEPTIRSRHVWKETFDVEPSVHTRNDYENDLIYQSRYDRIIGGNEIKAHSQPWLALLCNTNVIERW